MSVPADLRPRFHVRASRGWINDPNGPIFWNGAYHLFFQHNAHAAEWGPPTWGHAVSPDLVTWTVPDDALTPTPGGPDEGGCWSGCTVAHQGKVYAIYTGVGVDHTSQAVCAAVSDANLTWWRKLPAPLIPAPPDGLDPGWFRDPYVIPYRDGWLCVVGGGREGDRGMALLYSSDDLLSWDYAGPLYERGCSRTDSIFTGDMWECPQLFPLEQQHVLGVSVLHMGRQEHACYFLGHFDGRRFTPEASARLDDGPDYYAATSMRDPTGRRLMWGWSREALTDPARRVYDVAGCLTVPRAVTLQDGRLRIHPVDEVATLRDTQVGTYTGDLRHRAPVTLASDSGTGFDVVADLLPHRADRVELDVFACNYGLERTVIFLDVRAGSAGIDTTASTLWRGARTGVHSAPLTLRPDRPTTIRVIGDGSLLEVFIDGRPFTARVYPSRGTSRSIRLRAVGGTARVTQADAWTITAAAVRFPAARQRS